jgi:hypothetical protein
MRFISSRVCGEETQPCWNKPHFSTRSEAGYGFRKKTASFQPGGVGERSTAALEKAACFQSRSRLHCTRAGQKNALYFQPGVGGK